MVSCCQQLDIIGELHHHVFMRTTLTLDPDVAEQLTRAVRRRGKGLKATVNEALRIGLGVIPKSVEPQPFKIRVFVDGLQPGIDPDKMKPIAGRARSPGDRAEAPRMILLDLNLILYAYNRGSEFHLPVDNVAGDHS